jgi:hypothetical protein
MDSKRVAFRPAARVGVVAASLALLAIVISPSAAFADANLGSATANTTCSLPGLDSVQLSSSDPTISYVVPAGGGSITSWNSQSLGFTGLVGLQVWRPTTTAGTYQLVGASPLVVPTGTAVTLATPIPVLAGDMIGLHIEGTVACGTGTSSGLDSWAYAFGPTPQPLGTEAFNPPSNAFRINMSATVSTTTGQPGPGCDSTGDSNGSDSCKQDDKPKADKPEKTDKTDSSGNSDNSAATAARDSSN